MMENETVVTVTETVVVRPGRPVVEGSARQIRMAEMEAKRASGAKLYTGRPVNENSVRQQRLAAIAAKKENGEKLHTGRPINENSNRQIRLAEMAAKRAAGELKRGRPAMVKPVIVETPIIEATIDITSTKPAVKKSANKAEKVVA
jgi:hypothetical protein